MNLDGSKPCKPHYHDDSDLNHRYLRELLCLALSNLCEEASLLSYQDKADSSKIATRQLDGF